MLSPLTQKWLTMLSIYGWIRIILIEERLVPLKCQELIRPGNINNLIHIIDIYKIAKNNGVMALFRKSQSHQEETYEAVRE